MRRALLFFAVFTLLFCILTPRTHAFVRQQGIYGPFGFPSGEATVIVKAFSLHEPVGDIPGIPLYPGIWEEAIRDAVTRWNFTGANFTLHIREALPSDDPCNPQEGEIFIMLVENQWDSRSGETGPPPLCPGSTAITNRGWSAVIDGSWNYNATENWARIYIFWTASHSYEQAIRKTTHEIGHALGLGHSDVEEAIMCRSCGTSLLYPDDREGLRSIYGGESPPRPVAVLENPSQGKALSHVSGIGVFSGWACDAEEVLISIEGGEGTGVWRVLHKAAYGTLRLDTLEVCGDVHNGYSLLFNWNNLNINFFENLRHLATVKDVSEPLTFSLYVDGVKIAQTMVQVRTFGEEFLRGAPQTEYLLENFPEEGKSAIVKWQETLQNFVITGFSGNDE